MRTDTKIVVMPASKEGFSDLHTRPSNQVLLLVSKLREQQADRVPTSPGLGSCWRLERHGFGTLFFFCVSVMNE